MDANQLEATWGPRVLGILRIVTALLFMEHGAQKLLGFPPLPADRSMPELFTLLWFAGFLELAGLLRCRKHQGKALVDGPVLT